MGESDEVGRAVKVRRESEEIERRVGEISVVARVTGRSWRRWCEREKAALILRLW